jgi:hypothetical protein
VSVGRATPIAAAILVLIIAVPIHSQAAEEPAAGTFVSLKLEGDCDTQNKRLWVANTHTFKTIAVTVRWRAAGGKALTDQIFAGPNSVREIGCAAEAEILETKFADF